MALGSQGLDLGRLYRQQPEQQRADVRAAVLHQVASQILREQDRDPGLLRESLLADLARSTTLSSALVEAVELLVRPWWQSLARGASGSPDSSDRGVKAAHLLGEVLDLLLAFEQGDERRKLGSHFTPSKVASGLVERGGRLVVEQNKETLSVGPRVCDPACGGGAFLIEAGRWLATQRSQHTGEPLSQSRKWAVQCLHGIDLSALAVAATEMALWFFVADFGLSPRAWGRGVVADGLLDSLPARWADFDWIVGNPPWVAFQGRATFPISRERRATYRARFRAFSGYPTLQGLFVERATELAPRGVVTLLLPSSIADLQGYRATRSCLTTTHRPIEPLCELGQDAFEGVVQPCFGLQAAPRRPPSSADRGSDAAWLLAERTRQNARATCSAPGFLQRAGRLPVLPRQTFGELGFQSNRAAHSLFHRGEKASGACHLPLLEGRTVGEFCERAPRLFLNPDAERLRAIGCRLHAPERYQAVDFVVRQTAAYTIAAPHRGQAFRNSLIAGYANGPYDGELLVGLLNSSFYRALHCSRQRDARQAAFPQVKVTHLRGLPAPPESPTIWEQIRRLSRSATEAEGISDSGRRELDQRVFELFHISSSEAQELHAFLRSVAPRALGEAKN